VFVGGRDGTPGVQVGEGFPGGGGGGSWLLCHQATAMNRRSLMPCQCAFKPIKGRGIFMLMQSLASYLFPRACSPNSTRALAAFVTRFKFYLYVLYLQLSPDSNSTCMYCTSKRNSVLGEYITGRYICVFREEA